jgi:hypothetical protein
MELEIWRDIVGFEGYYQVSNCGRLKSFKKNPKGTVLSNTNKKGGYFSVVLEVRRASLIRYVRMHVLVAEAFIGERPAGLHVHHKDGNRQNNHASNLEYISAKAHSVITMKENPGMTAGMIRHNTEIRPRPILQLDLDGNFIKEHINGMEAHRKTGVCHRNLYAVAATEEYKPGLTRKQAGGFIWKFKEDVK